MSAIKYQKVPTNTSKYQIYHTNNIHLSYTSFKSCFFRKSPKVSKSHQNIKKVSESSKMYLISRSSTESLFSLVFKMKLTFSRILLLHYFQVFVGQMSLFDWIFKFHSIIRENPTTVAHCKNVREHELLRWRSSVCSLLLTKSRSVVVMCSATNITVHAKW